MADETPDIAAGQERPDDLRALRHAVVELGKALRAFGRSRMAEIGEEISEEAQAAAHEGTRMFHAVEQRLVQLERQAEKSVREHPAAWASGLLGAIGFGILLGLILRRHD